MVVVVERVLEKCLLLRRANKTLIMFQGELVERLTLPLMGYESQPGNYPAKMILYTQKTNLSIFYKRALLVY